MHDSVSLIGRTKSTSKERGGGDALWTTSRPHDSQVSLTRSFPLLRVPFLSHKHQSGPRPAISGLVRCAGRIEQPSSTSSPLINRPLKQSRTLVILAPLPSRPPSVWPQAGCLLRGSTASPLRGPHVSDTCIDRCLRVWGADKGRNSCIDCRGTSRESAWPLLARYTPCASFRRDEALMRVRGSRMIRDSSMRRTL